MYKHLFYFDEKVRGENVKYLRPNSLLFLGMNTSTPAAEIYARKEAIEEQFYESREDKSNAAIDFRNKLRTERKAAVELIGIIESGSWETYCNYTNLCIRADEIATKTGIVANDFPSFKYYSQMDEDSRQIYEGQFHKLADFIENNAQAFFDKCAEVDKQAIAGGHVRLPQRNVLTFDFNWDTGKYHWQDFANVIFSPNPEKALAAEIELMDAKLKLYQTAENYFKLSGNGLSGFKHDLLETLSIAEMIDTADIAEIEEKTAAYQERTDAYAIFFVANGITDFTDKKAIAKAAKKIQNLEPEEIKQLAVDVSTLRGKHREEPQLGAHHEIGLQERTVS